MNTKLPFRIITFLVVLVTLYILVQYFILPKEYVGYLYWKREALQVNLWYPMLYAHLTFGSIALCLLPFQLSRRLLQKKPMVHRYLGRISVISIVISALSGLFIGFYAEGGLTGKLGFITLAILWLVTTGLALAKIKQGDKVLHRQWMLRCAALTCAAITLRVLLPVFIIGLGMEYNEAAKYIAWLAWVPNLLIIEIFLYLEKNKGKALSNMEMERLN